MFIIKNFKGSSSRGTIKTFSGLTKINLLCLVKSDRLSVLSTPLGICWTKCLRSVKEDIVTWSMKQVCGRRVRMFYLFFTEDNLFSGPPTHGHINFGNELGPCDMPLLCRIERCSLQINHYTTQMQLFITDTSIVRTAEIIKPHYATNNIESS